MKNIKIGLRIWILLTSVISFLTGWVMLAHAGKPASLFLQTQTTPDPASSQTANLPIPLPMPTLITPIPLDNGSSTSSANLQPLPALPVIQQQQNFLPSLRTRGS
jgi:hypothetical protein